MSKESNLEWKVGLFVLCAIVGLCVFIFSVSDFSIFAEGYEVRVVFHFANGLKENAPVRIAGVDEGVVKAINLFFDTKEKKTKVEIVLWIQDKIKIPRDSTVMINQLGLLGEKYVEIIPGVDTQQFYGEKEIIIGRDPIAQEIISEKVLEVAKKLDESISGVNKIINDEENRRSIGETLQNLSRVTSQLEDILDDLKQGKGTMGQLFYDEGLYDDLRGMAGDLRENPWKLLYRPKQR